MNNSLKNFFKFLFILALVSSSYFGGFLVGHRNIIFENGYIPKLANTELYKPNEVDFSLFWDAWNIVKNKYVGDTDTQKMTYGAISGMVASLGDQFSMYMTPDEAKNFEEDLKGSFDGIGAELESKSGYLVIVAPLDGSPAEKAGLLAQDIITKVDGKSVPDMNYSEAVANIRGKKGTQVVLSIVRKGEQAPLEIKVTRDTIVVKSVSYEMKGDICYIKMSQFGDDTLELMKKASDFALQNNAKGIILDLRNNPGGYLESAIDISSLFLDGGVIVKEKDKNGKIKEFKTTLVPRLKDKKLVVLVNGGSASSSEIMSGAIQDRKRGILIGEKTYGKGSVQNLEELKDKSEVRVTIAKWLTPNGNSIDKAGITPDIEVKLTSDDKQNNRDPQLDRAIEEINK